jgi:hypothetical protein
MSDAIARDNSLDFPGAEALQAAGRVAPPSAQTVDRTLAAVLAAAEAEQAVQAEARTVAAEATAPAAATRATKGGTDLVVTPLPTRRLLSGRRLLAIAVAACAAAGVVVAASTGGALRTGEQRAGQTQQSVAAHDPSALLDHLAAVAATQSTSTAPYWKMQLRSLVVGRTSTVTVFVSRSGYVIKSHGKTYTKGAPTWSVGTKLVDWNGLDQLPTDPATLLSMMSAGLPTRGQGVFDQAGSILGGSPASPALRAALFKALGKLPGVKVVGTVTDANGRKGTEIVFPGSQSTDAVIVDPNTATVLQTVAWQTGGINRTVFLSVGPAMNLD